MKGLTPRQIQQYQDEGFLIIRDLIGPKVIQPLIGELEQSVNDAAHEAIERGLLTQTDAYPNASFPARLALMSASCSDPDFLWSRIEGKRHKTAGMFTVRTCSALLDIVESLIGPEILAHPQTNLRAKLPKDERGVVPWHQDLAYLVPEDAGETLIVNFWIPLVRATAENGCMQVIRGSHRSGLLPHNLRESTFIGITEADLPAGDIVTCELDVGDVLITMERVLHRSIPNVSDTVRWSLDTRYSRLGLPTGRTNIPGFVARSHQHPEKITRSHHDWIRLYTEAGINWLEN